MYNLMDEAKGNLRALLAGAAKAAMESGALPQAELPAFTVEIPSDHSHGDFATNLAMVSAKSLHKAPRQIAQAICEKLDLTGTYFHRFEIAGPGFLNFFLDKAWYGDVLKTVLARGDDYGKSDYGQNKKVMVEFVSANPTGPMHMGNARGGALGDGLAEAMRWAGFDVTKEFYVNDAGNQIAKFGISLEARYLQIFLGEEAPPLPEDAYQGDDIRERAQEYADLYGDKLVQVDSETRRQALVDYALPKNVEGLKRDLGKYRVIYDKWFFESSLYADGTVEKVLDILKNKDLAYEKEGAIWYKATEFGAEKDEVLVRANGLPTYFAADIAYHYNKFAIRGFEKVINVWGADHHGHVARLKGAMDAIGLDGSKLDIVLMQLVRLMKDGEVVRMSKRTGKSITLTDLLEEVPIDAARFFFNLREPNSQMDFDLGLAVEQSSQNPVYYVQYAHARICSILKNLQEEGVSVEGCSKGHFDLLGEAEEIELIRLLAQFPEEIVEAAKRYDPARITRYVLETATGFHKFYNACRVKGAERDLLEARLLLCSCVKTVIKNALTMLAIGAPESM